MTRPLFDSKAGVLKSRSQELNNPYAIVAVYLLGRDVSPQPRIISSDMERESPHWGCRPSTHIDFPTPFEIRFVPSAPGDEIHLHNAVSLGF